MKKPISKALLLAVGAALAAQPAFASNSLTAGDLIVGFRDSSASKDVIVDIGQASTYLNATQNIDVNSLLGSTTLSSVLEQVFNGSATSTASLQGVNWSVAQYEASGFTSLALTDPSGTSTPINATALADAGAKVSGYAVLYAQSSAANTVIANRIADPANSGSTSYNHEAPNVNSYLPFNYESQVVGGYSSGNTTTAALYTFDTSGDAGVAAPNSGEFVLNADGDLQYDITVPAPEPALYGVFAGAGLLALSLRRQFRRQNA